MTTLRDNGEEFEMRRGEIRKLRAQKMIYWCPSCAVYHIADGFDWDDIEREGPAAGAS